MFSEFSRFSMQDFGEEAFSEAFAFTMQQSLEEANVIRFAAEKAQEKHKSYVSSTLDYCWMNFSKIASYLIRHPLQTITAALVVQNAIVQATYSEGNAKIAYWIV